LDDRPPWRPEEALTLEQALLATCVTPAWLSHDERARGTLVPGRLGDLVVLDRDPFACEPEELPRVQVVATMLAGRWGHNPPPWGCDTGVPPPIPATTIRAVSRTMNQIHEATTCAVAACAEII